MAALALVLSGLLAACAASPQASADALAGAGESDHAPRVYSLRGQVLFIPEAGKVAQLFIEPIPDWVDESGQVVGMSSMAMTWPLADGVPFEGLEATDIVAFTVEVDWSAATPARITRLEKLPADTELAYGVADAQGHARQMHADESGDPHGAGDS